MIRGQLAHHLCLLLRPPMKIRIHQMLIFADLYRPCHRDCTLLASDQPTEDGSFVEGELEAPADDGVEPVGFEGGSDGDEVAGPVASMVTIGDEGEPLVSLPSRLVLAVDGPGGVRLMLVNDDGCELGLHTRFFPAEEASGLRVNGVK